MECRTLNLTVISAEDLKKVTFFSKMEVYVAVTLQDDSTYQHQKHKTPYDKNGDRNPLWNFPMKFTLNETALHGNRITLRFELFSRRTLLPDKLIGQVHVTASDLVSSVGKTEGSNASYQVLKRSGKPKGVLNFSYRLGDKFTSVTQVTPGPGIGYPYSAPQYAYPAPAGNAYPPRVVNGYGQGYGQQQAVQPQGRRNNNPGMGFGTGLLGGALAGFIVGDLLSDIGNDGGCDDGGFDDGGYEDSGSFDDGGFDF